MADAGHMGQLDEAERSLAALKRLRRVRRTGDVCEICSRELASEHPHLIEPAARRIVCACEACAVLFDGGFDAGLELRYRRIPRDTFLLQDLQIDGMDWESLNIPIGLAFFLMSSATGRIAGIYPSPGGATETELSLDAWSEIAGRDSRVQQMLPDVEALLVNRLSGASQCYLTPIDRCYELTGVLRKYWRGFNGGDEVWTEVERFFARLREQAILVGAKHARSAV